MRRILIHLDVETIRHNPDFAFDDAAVEREIAQTMAACMPRRIGVGRTGLKIPDGKGGFIDKPAILIVLAKVGVEAVPDEGVDQPKLNGHATVTPPRIAIP